MAYQIVDVKIPDMGIAPPLPADVELSEDVQKQIQRMGGDPERLRSVPAQSFLPGYLESISNEVDAAFRELGYSSSGNMGRRVSEGFFPSVNIVYDTKKEGDIHLVTRKPYGTLVLGFVVPPINDEIIGMVRTEILNGSSPDLLERVKECYRKHSDRFVVREIHEGRTN